jgi:hypothetical protein
LAIVGERVTTLRKALRRVVHRLPDREQLLVRRATAALRRPDWADAVGRVRASESAFIDDTAAHHRRVPGRRRVMVCVLQQFPPVAEVSYSLAMAMRLRGHDVTGILCDGIVPMCEMNLGHLDRPSCGVCATWASRYEAAFGFSFARLTELVTMSDREQAEALVAATPASGLRSLMVDGVPVGTLARRELQRYHRGFVADPERDPAFRAWIVSGVLLVRLAARLFARERPEILLISSGRTLLAGCLSMVAAAQGIRVVSWDLENSHSDGLVFSHDEPAVLLPLDAAWAQVRGETLSAEARTELQAFLRRWARSENTPFAYNPQPVEDRARIRRELGLRPDAPLIVAFANAAWDMAAVDRDAGFASMFDWLFALVDYALAHSDVDLVVRAHPAEVNVPSDLKSRTPVVAELRRRFPNLPNRIVLLEGDTAISSYALAEIAQVPMMYATRLGLEMAVRGRRPWLAGVTTYRGRGFTRDISSPDEMVAWLDARTFDERLAPDEIALAERFAYLWFFRYVVRLPLLRPPTRQFTLRSFHDLAPGRHPVLDRICDAMADGTPFLDLVSSVGAKLHG